MKITRWVAGGAVGVLFGVMSMASAFANDPSLGSGANADPNEYGTVTFYDATGNVITSGSTTDPQSMKYAVANSNPGNLGNNSAGLVFIQPNPGTPVGTWGGVQLNANNTYPIATAPAPLNTSPNAATQTKTTTKTLAVAASQFVANPAPFDNVYQIRVVTPGSGVYAAATIKINPATSRWTQTFPVPVAGPTSTVTTLSASPTSPATAPVDVTLTANVSAGGVGTVEFFNGTTSLGTSPVSGGGATKLLTAVAAGSYSYKATFTPTSAAAFSGSTSGAVAYTVNAAGPAKTPTTTTLAITPATAGTAPASATLTATVGPTGVAGTVEFFEGTTSLGAAVPVSNDKASFDVTGLAARTYSYSAQFVPTNTTTFTGSTGTAPAYTVKARPVVATTTALTANPTTGTAPATVTLTATVSPSAADGSVRFDRGTTSIGIVPVTAGTATKLAAGLPAGDYSYTATFIPTDSTAYATSTSPSVTVIINSPPGVTPTPSPVTSAPTTTTPTTTATASATSPAATTSTTPAGTATSAKPTGTATTTPTGTATTAPTGTTTTTAPSTVPTATATAPTGTGTTPAGDDTVTATVGGKVIGENPTVAPGTTLKLVAAGFIADEMVDVDVEGKKIGQVKADAKGAISYVLVVPSDQADGKVAVDFKGASATRTFAFTVAADAAATPTPTTESGTGVSGSSSSTTDAVISQSGSGNLPRTGSDVGPLLVSALLLLLVGAAGLVAAQRMRLTRGSHL